MIQFCWYLGERLQSLEAFHVVQRMRLDYLEFELHEPILCSRHQVPQEFFLRVIHHQHLLQRFKDHLLEL